MEALEVERVLHFHILEAVAELLRKEASLGVGTLSRIVRMLDGRITLYFRQPLEIQESLARQAMSVYLVSLELQERMQLLHLERMRLLQRADWVALAVLVAVIRHI